MRLTTEVVVSLGFPLNMSGPDSTFDALVRSRKSWIDDSLRPWCRQAPRTELLKAEEEWGDIAGRAAPEQTLWTWAWERFPALVYDGLTGVNETRLVRVRLKTGEAFVGFPEGRLSQRGELVLLTGEDPEADPTGDLTEAGPFSLDDIDSVDPVDQ